MEAHARRVLDLSRDEFWSLTIREYSRECAIAAKRAVDEYNRDVTQAWKTVAMVCEAFSKTGLRGLTSHLIRESADGATERARDRMRWDVFAARNKLGRRPMSQATRDALRRLKADEARNNAMAAEAIRDALKH